MDEVCSCGHGGGLHSTVPPHRCTHSCCSCSVFLAAHYPVAPESDWWMKHGKDCRCAQCIQRADEHLRGVAASLGPIAPDFTAGNSCPVCGEPLPLVQRQFPTAGGVGTGACQRCARSMAGWAGLMAGLADVAAGRTKPLADVRVLLARDATEGSEEPISCMDCGLTYRDHGLDCTLSDEQWAAIGGTDILCATCICRRAARLQGTWAVRARIEGRRWPAPTPANEEQVVNINRRVRIVLQQPGIDAWNDFYKWLEMPPPRPLQVGDTLTSELWNVMAIFGRSCGNGLAVPFNTEMVLLPDDGR